MGLTMYASTNNDVRKYGNDVRKCGTNDNVRKYGNVRPNLGVAITADESWLSAGKWESLDRNTV